MSIKTEGKYIQTKNPMGGGGFSRRRNLKSNYQKSTSLFLIFAMLFQIVAGAFLLTPTQEAKADSPISWYNSSWQYRKTITVDHTKIVNTDQTNFPVLISLSNIEYRDIAHGGRVGKPNGGDILFTTSDKTTKLSHEIERYDNITGEIEAWVKIPTLSASLDTVIYIYYGNAAGVDQADSVNVWDSGYVIVQHMQDATSTTTKDSTTNNNNGAKLSATSPTQTQGKIGLGENFDGSTSRIGVAASNSLNATSLTLEAWVKPNAGYGQTAPRIFEKGKYILNMDTSGYAAFFVTVGGTAHSTSTTTSIPTSSWSYLTTTFDTTLGSNQQKIYLNGVLNNQRTQAGSIDDSTSNALYIGDIGTGTRVFNGVIDEVRISNIARSADWIKTGYNNHTNPSAFYTVGQTEIYVPNWYNSNWQYRKAITIDYTKVASINHTDQTNFPVLVSLNDIEYKDASHGGKIGKSNGGDILFTASDETTKLSHEIEKYDSTTGEIEAWVKIPTLSASVNTVIYIYYGNAAGTDQADPTSVWDSNYVMVQHMQDLTSTTTKDSTVNNNNGAKLSATSPIQTQGKIGLGESFNGSTDRIGVTASNSLDTTSQLTLEAWVNPNAGYGQLAPRIFEKGKYILNMDTSGRISFFVTVGGTQHSTIATNVIPVSSWSFVTTTFDTTLGSNQQKVYLNGVVDKQQNQAGPIDDSLSDTLYIGNMVSGARGFNGIIDEVRISNVARSADWIKTGYNNHTTPSAFYAVGQEENSLSSFSPTSPTNIVATGGSGQVSLSWSAPDFDGGSPITDYVVEYRTGSNNFTALNDDISTQTVRLITGLTNAISYDFRLAAATANGTSGYSVIVSATPISPIPEAPVAQNVSINGTAVVNNVLTGSYSYQDDNGDSEGATSFRWLRADSLSGEYSPIAGATSLTYVLSNNDGGRFIKFEVIPVSVIAPVLGDPARSVATAQIGNALPYLYHILSTGQSLSLGSHGAPALTTIQPYENQAISGVSLVPLIEGAGLVGYAGSETISSAMANFITSQVPNFQSVVSVHGVGGTGYSGLKKGTAPYAAGLSQATTVKTIADGSGKMDRVIGVTVIHGEANAGSAAGTYKGYLEEWQNDYNTDVKAITGQYQDIPMFTDQMNSFTAYGITTSYVPIDQLAASEDNPGKIYLVGPKYFLNYSPDDGVHLTNTSYRWLGEYYGKVIKKVVVDGVQWKPLSPKQIFRSDNKIYAKFNVPVGSLQFDTSLVLAKQNYGFEYYDNNSSASINSVELIGNDTVKITLSTVPTGANQRLRYAYSGVAGSFGGAQQAGSARGNLRDNDNTPSQYGNTLYDWAVSFDKSITGSDITPPASFSLVSPIPNSITSVRGSVFSWNASSDDESGLSKYQLYIDGVMDKDNISNSTISVSSGSELSCGTHSWYIKAVDDVGNSTNSNTFNLNINCAGGFTPPAKPNVSATTLTLSPEGKLNLNNLPTDITKIAISTTPDFKDVSWEDISKKDELLQKYADAPKLYLKFKTKEGAVSDTITYEKGNSNNPVIPSSSYPTGTLLKLPNSPRVYVVIDGKKKWISTPEVFEQLGYKWTDIKTITETELNTLLDYEDNLIRQQGDYKVYLVVNGIKRHIPNPEVFLDYGFSWSDIKEVDKATMDKYKETSLIKESGKNEIYYITNGIRKWIPTMDVFNSYNDKMEDVQIISKKEMESYPLSNLIRLNNSNDIYLIEGNIKKHIPNPTVFNKYKLNWNYVMSVNQTEFNFYQNGGELK